MWHKWKLVAIWDIWQYWPLQNQHQVYIYVEYEDMFSVIYVIYLSLPCECQLSYWAIGNSCQTKPAISRINIFSDIPSSNHTLFYRFMVLDLHKPLKVRRILWHLTYWMHYAWEHISYFHSSCVWINRYIRRQSSISHRYLVSGICTFWRCYLSDSLEQKQIKT